MIWSIFLVVLGIVVVGIRVEQIARRLNWSKFALTLGFMAVVCTIITLPLVLMDMNNPYFWPVYGFAWAVALGLMIWYIIWARSWKLSNNKNDEQPRR